MDETRGLWRGKRYVPPYEWVEGFLTYRDFDPVQSAAEITVESGANYNVNPETLGECTGLRDKNGKLIFEGDIVKYQFDNDDCAYSNKNTEPIIGKIFFSDFRASFSVTAGRNCSSKLNNDLFKYVRNGNRVEVIGNIHDNPELLKGENQ